MADTFDDALKTISSLNLQLEVTQKLLKTISTTLGNTGNSPLASFARSLEADIARINETISTQASKAVSNIALKTRLDRGYSPPTPPPSPVIPELESRGYLRAVELKNKRIESSKNAEILKAGREIAERTLNQIQEDLLKGAISARAVQQYDSNNKIIARNELLRKFGVQTGSLFGSGGRPTHQAVSFIPSVEEVGGSEGPLTRRMNDYRARKDIEWDSNMVMEAEIRKKSAESVRKQELDEWAMRHPISARIVDTEMKKTETVSQDSQGYKGKSTKFLEVEKLENERLQGLRNIVSEEKKYANAIKIARERGFDVKDLKNVYNRGTDIDRLQFQKYDTSGARKDLDLYVNKAGKATPGISNQFRSFGSGIVRDIGELTKWSIALAAVYGPLNKLGELTQEMIANQSKLADATTAVNSSFLDQGAIFDIAANSANGAGEAVGGVIDAFTQAYRATGGSTNQVERLATAQKLLNDSLVLSKLSTLDQATAIDTLSAALRQTADSTNKTLNPLAQGTALLDKWVRVTKIANVDMTTLATSFAVVGDSADAVGVSADNLNGIIAAVAETGVGSAKEVANVGKSLISGFQSEQAQKELENLGISVRDVTTGELRPFLQVMQQVYNLKKSGVIDDTAFSKLTLALGGGTRRQAVYATFLENFNRVYEVSGQSAKANGDAQAALARQLDTVQTSLVRLGNAFSSLAQSAGSEGGFLTVINALVSLSATFVNGFEGIVKVLGKANPLLAAFVATTLLLKNQGYKSIQEYVGGALGKTGVGGISNIDARMGGIPIGKAQSSFGFGADNFAYNTKLGSLGSGALQGIITATIPALLNVTNKSDPYGKTKAGFDVVGGIAGGIVGSLTGAGPIVGATIGTAISEAFVNATVARKTDIFGYTKDITYGPSTKSPTTADEATKNLEYAVSEIYKSIGGGSEGLGKVLTAGAEKQTKSLVDQINKAIQEQDKSGLESILGGRYGKEKIGLLQKAGLSVTDIQTAFSSGQQINVSPERVAYANASKEAQQAYDEARVQSTLFSKPSDLSTFSSTQVALAQAQYKPILEQIQKESLKGLSDERITGNLRGSQYAQQVRSLQGFDQKSLQYITAIGEEFINVDKNINNSTEAFKAFSVVFTKGSAESVTEVTSIVNEIQDLQDLLNAPEYKGKDILPFKGSEYTRAQLQEQVQQLKQTGANTLSDIYAQTLQKDIKLPSLVGDYNQAPTRPENQQIISKGLDIQKRFYESVGLSAEEIDTLIAAIEDFKTPVQEAGQTLFDTVSGLEERFYSLGKSALEAEGKLASIGGFGLQKFDVDRATLENLAQQSIVTGQNWQTQTQNDSLPGFFQAKPEDLLAITNDGLAKPIHADMRILALLLEKLNDKAQKQLDGQYNIPEGATFWVPLTAAYYRNTGDGGAGGLPATDSLATTSNTTATQENTNALRSLSDRFNNDDKFRLKNDPDSFKSGKPSTVREDRFLMKNEAGPYEKDLDTRKIVPNIPYYRGGATDQPTQKESGGFVDTLKNLLGWLTGSGSGKTGGGLESRDGRVGLSDTVSTAPTAFKSLNTGTSVNPNPATKLDLKLSSNTTLNLDGRIIASALQNYLASELLRTEQTQGTITKNYTI